VGAVRRFEGSESALLETWMACPPDAGIFQIRRSPDRFELK